jgi:hypothetical protein
MRLVLLSTLCMSVLGASAARSQIINFQSDEFSGPLDVQAGIQQIAPHRVQQQMFIVNQDVMLGDEFNEMPAQWSEMPQWSPSYRPEMTEEQMRNQIQNALQRMDAQDRNVWARRDAMEESLLSLGTAAVPTMRSELNTHEGYEADALWCAIFRLENAPLTPKDLLRQWGAKRFPEPNPDALKISRVLDIKETNMKELYPHHLFYALENPKDNSRAVVALAADGKIQPLADDAAIAKFLRGEGSPQTTTEDRKRLATTAALLACARTMTLYKPDKLTAQKQGTSNTGDIISVDLQASEYQLTTTVTYDARGTVQTISTQQNRGTAKPLTPLILPTTIPAPPPMPE